MSTSKAKKVHYERGTKSGHRSSRDSGIGSSSASDRASIGEWDESPLSYSQMQEQRHNVDVLREALDAANATIRQLESANKKLNEALSDSNKENRQLRKEKGALLDRLDRVEDRLEAVQESTRRETSPRSATKTSPPRSPPRIEAPQPRVTSSVPKARRNSILYDLPTAPPPPPNPFFPINNRAPTTNYAQSPTISYAPSSMSYQAGPVYVTAPPPPSPSSRAHYSTPNDGRYHLQPL